MESKELVARKNTIVVAVIALEEYASAILEGELTQTEKYRFNKTIRSLRKMTDSFTKSEDPLLKQTVNAIVDEIVDSFEEITSKQLTIMNE